MNGGALKAGLPGPETPGPRRWAGLDGGQWFFVGFVLLAVGGGAAAALGRISGVQAALPALGVVGALAAAARWRYLYYGLLALLPFSVQLYLPGGLSLDVPSEPLMLLLTACVLGTLLLRAGRLPAREWAHPLVLLLAAGLAWAAFASCFSVAPLKSVKYLLAKGWYVVPFVLGTLLLVRRPPDVWRLALPCALGTALSVAYVAARHASAGFSFGRINWALRPFYLNHVIYAALLALLLPFCLQGWRAAAGRPARRWLWAGLGAVLLFGLLTSYTRASWLSVPAAGLLWGVVRLRQTRALLLLAVLAGAGAAAYFAYADNYMRYRTNYEHTVFNGHDFGKHLAATYSLQDVSGMERVYRWVAAARMVADRPVLGSGPATFYPEYKRYTVKGFRTYVSANPEQSTTHNYFLLQMAEQGVPGFLLFVALLGTALLTAERLYHRSAGQPAVRAVVLAALLSLTTIIFHLLLNELVEVDKIGPLYFICLALLVKADTWLGGASPDASLSEE